MDNNETEESMENAPSIPQTKHDPYPKMIIVCFAISLFLLLIIILVAMVDFMQRDMGQEIKPKNPAFFEEHLRNSPAPEKNEVI
jgi:amino acid transporter